MRKAIAIDHARFLFKESQLPSGHPRHPATASTSIATAATTTTTTTLPSTSIPDKLDERDHADAIEEREGVKEDDSKQATLALKTLLMLISSTLQKIQAVFALDSMLLVVSPIDHSEAWLGGTVVGRDFWRGLRGGGVTGSRAFKRASKTAYDAAVARTNAGSYTAIAESLPSSPTGENTGARIEATPTPSTSSPGLHIRMYNGSPRMKSVAQNSATTKTELNRLVRQTLRYVIAVLHGFSYLAVSG